MPPRRRNGYRTSKRPSLPRPRPKKPYIPDPRTAVGMARLAYSGVKYLKNLINVEKQKVDFTVSNGGVSTTPSVVHLSAIAVGDAEGSRTGNSLLSKYLYIKGSLLMNGSALATKVRLVFIRDKQQVGDTSPGYTDVYEAANTLAFLNKNTVGRFDVLFDKTYNLDTINNQVVMPDLYLKLNSHIRYNGTASTDIQKGGLYAMIISDQATNTPTCSIFARLMYVDN